MDRPCLEALAAQGVKLVALRCTGFNNVDIAAAKALNLAVTRVAVYSPYAVAEHAVAMLLTLNRKIHRAYNRTRESNFTIDGLMGFDLHGKTAGVVGTGKIGAIVAPNNPLYVPRELEFQLNDAGAESAARIDAGAELVRDAAPQPPDATAGVVPIVVPRDAGQPDSATSIEPEETTHKGGGCSLATVPASTSLIPLLFLTLAVGILRRR